MLMRVMVECYVTNALDKGLVHGKFNVVMYKVFLLKK